MEKAVRHASAGPAATAERGRAGPVLRRDSRAPLGSTEVRRRLAEAWAEALPVHGYRRTTVRHLLALSGISRSAFYGHFAGKEDAFVAVHGDALAWLAARVGGAADREPEWPRRVAAGLATALQLLAENPRYARLLLGDLFAAGPQTGYCHELLVDRFSPCLAAGRSTAAASDRDVPPRLEAVLLGSAIGLAESRLRAGEAERLPELTGPLTQFVLTPYLGAEAAQVPLAAPPGES